MRYTLRTTFLAGSLILLLGLPACSHFSFNSLKFWGKKTPVAAIDQGQRADLETELKTLVREHIKSVGQSEDLNNARLVRKKPYYFREFEAYPNGPDDFEIKLNKIETRSNQYMAQVRITKTRYATRFMQRKADAQSDAHFQRGTGTETITYEFRNNHWVRIGSLFMTGPMEEYINGEWIPVKEEVRPNPLREDEPEKGWFKKTWFWLTGA